MVMDFLTCEVLEPLSCWDFMCCMPTILDLHILLPPVAMHAPDSPSPQLSIYCIMATLWIHDIDSTFQAQSDWLLSGTPMAGNGIAIMCTLLKVTGHCQALQSAPPDYDAMTMPTLPIGWALTYINHYESVGRALANQSLIQQSWLSDLLPLTKGMILSWKSCQEYESDVEVSKETETEPPTLTAEVPDSVPFKEMGNAADYRWEIDFGDPERGNIHNFLANSSTCSPQ
ncbi:hypothetical protein EDC04DRAFT_2611233 [Pisolithus marmoratus]|nr:hypothetical protein EDC04DRAFT_2611233 [Pisolithus marmoratus]